MIQRFRGTSISTAIVLSLAAMMTGCTTSPEVGEQDLLRQAGSAFMEGFLPTRVQMQNAITYPGYMAGQALAR